MSLPTVRELAGQAAGWLAERGVPSARLDADLMLAEVLGLRRLDLYLDLDRPLEPAEVDRYRELVRRRGHREPLAYVLGHWSFRGHDSSRIIAVAGAGGRGKAMRQCLTPCGFAMPFSHVGLCS